MVEGGERSSQQQPHKSGSEFFICFTARPSSSAAAMRVPSSKSLASPGRGGAPSLSASLSRRLRSSGSVKGGQSPMFPSGNPSAGGAASGSRRKGCAYEAAEPSSPKVTCIGQVRVKSKNKKKKMMKNNSSRASSMRSRSQRSQGEASFRRNGGTEGVGKSQSWVYQLPVSICDAIRALGSELNCAAPCGAGRCSRPEKRRPRSSCAAALARWVVAVQEEGVKKGGEVVDLVVEEREKGEVMSILFREREKKEDDLRAKAAAAAAAVEEEEEVAAPARVSVCIPPRNALLLMRCRSDPVRVAALADRFWGSPAAVAPPVVFAEDFEDENVGREEEEEEVKAEIFPFMEEEAAESLVDLKNPTEGDDEKLEAAAKLDSKDDSFLMEREEGGGIEGKRLSTCSSASSSSSTAKEKEMRRTSSCSSSSSSSKAKGRRRSFSSKDHERRRHSFSTEREARRASFSVDRDGRRRWSFSVEKGELICRKSISSLLATAQGEKPSKEVVVVTPIGDELSEPNTAVTSKAHTAETQNTAVAEVGEAKAEKKTKELPDCLLLMMYEPKLSMEVSKETWVCSTDFLHYGHRTHHPISKPAAAAAGEATATPAEPEREPLPPPPAPMEPAVEEKLASCGGAAVGAYGPFVLTRCKSEPVRASARLAAEDCFWKSRHRPIGAAGVGF